MEKKLLEVNEYRKIQIDILDAVAKICNDNNIRYFLAGGTLLGAVRHKGYIPWDDDIDIILLRDDYDKLISILKNQTEFSWLDLIDDEKDGYIYPFAKAVNNKTVAKQSDNLTEHGIWVDIFPYDNLPVDPKKSQKYLNKGYFYRGLILSFLTDFTTDKKGGKLVIKKLVKYFKKFCLKFKNVDTNYVGCVFTPYRTRERFAKEWFKKDVLLEFEGKFYNAPSEYDKVLTQLYGDYMKLPPVEKRTHHSIEAWWID